MYTYARKHTRRSTKGTPVLPPSSVPNEEAASGTAANEKQQQTTILRGHFQNERIASS